MTAEYVGKLTTRYPRIREVWLYGSRANNCWGPDSDWDYLAFADDDTLADLASDVEFHITGIDLMVVADGVRFAKPWIDDGRQKTGTLSTDDGAGGLAWKLISPSEARYRATKPGEGFAVKVLEDQKAIRVYPR
jgi:Nucleotidyltransferase domain